MFDLVGDLWAPLEGAVCRQDSIDLTRLEADIPEGSMIEVSQIIIRGPESARAANGPEQSPQRSEWLVDPKPPERQFAGVKSGVNAENVSNRHG